MTSLARDQGLLGFQKLLYHSLWGLPWWSLDLGEQAVKNKHFSNSKSSDLGLDTF